MWEFHDIREPDLDPGLVASCTYRPAESKLLIVCSILLQAFVENLLGLPSSLFQTQPAQSLHIGAHN